MDNVTHIEASVVETTERPFTVIEPSKGLMQVDWAELWQYRELFVFLVWQQIAVRYKQTVLGASWALLQPLIMMLILSVIFGRLAQMPSDGVPYPLFILAGLVPWNFFAQSLTYSSGSLVNNANLVTKVYFPRLVMPIAPVLACFVDFCVAFVLLLFIMAYYATWPAALIWLLPLMLALMVITASGAGMLFSALMVKYRDFRHIIPYLVQLGMYVTPVVFPLSQVPERWHWVYGLLNPVAGAVAGFRASLLGTSTDLVPLIVASAVSSVGYFLVGLYYFRRAERFFADVI